MAGVLPIPEELAAEMTPGVRAFVETLLKRIAELEARVEQLQTQAGQTPRNSSLPPSSKHPHARPAPVATFNRRQHEPTNNASERALRPAVIWRKLSFGTQSFVERR